MDRAPDGETISTSRLNAKIAGLHRAHDLLTAAGIGSRHSRPRRDRGILRVARADAARAREILADGVPRDELITAAGAAWFFCHAADTPAAPDASLRAPDV